MTDFFDSLDAARERAGFASALGDGTEEYVAKAVDGAESGLLIPSHWNPHWNYHLGGEPRSICACLDGPYCGAALVGTPPYCERCGGLVGVLPPAECAHGMLVGTFSEGADDE